MRSSVSVCRYRTAWNAPCRSTASTALSILARHCPLLSLPLRLHVGLFVGALLLISLGGLHLRRTFVPFSTCHLVQPTIDTRTPLSSRRRLSFCLSPLPFLAISLALPSFVPWVSCSFVFASPFFFVLLGLLEWLAVPTLCLVRLSRGHERCRWCICCIRCM